MSTLTKIVIVLLTLASFFLCASIVVYVGTADNYKQQSSKMKVDKDAAVAKANASDEELKKYKEQTELEQKKLNEQITELKNEVSKVTTNLNTSKLEVSQLTQRVESMAQSVATSTATADKQTALFKETQDKLKEAEKKLSDLDTMNKQLTDKLDSQLAAMDTLEKEKKRLLEDKSDLEAQLNEKLMPGGKVAVAGAHSVTVSDASVRVKPKEAVKSDDIVRDINLKGTIIDMKDSMASISVGAVDGVKAGMEFFVIRGDEFVCKIQIIDVDETQSAGKLKLLGQLQPRKGDVVTTNL